LSGSASGASSRLKEAGKRELGTMLQYEPDVPESRALFKQNMITWTLVIFVYSGSGMIQSSITGYSSYAECNKAGINWMKNKKTWLKEYYCVSLKIKSGPRR
jgi:hypothetical protein